MKKIILLILIAFLNTGCSKDETVTNPTATNDPIIGKWKLVKEVYFNSQNVSGIERNASSCEILTSIEHKSNNTSTLISYSTGSNSSCSLDNNNWEYFRWSNLGSNNYKFISKITGQSEEIETLNIEFQNLNTMIIKDNSGGIYNGQNYSYSKEFYTKI